MLYHLFFHMRLFKTNPQLSKHSLWSMKESWTNFSRLFRCEIGGRLQFVRIEFLSSALLSLLSLVARVVCYPLYSYNYYFFKSQNLCRYLRLTKRFGHGFWCSKFLLLGWSWGLAQTTDNWAIAWSGIHIDLSPGNKKIETPERMYNFIHGIDINTIFFWGLFRIVIR